MAQIHSRLNALSHSYSRITCPSAAPATTPPQSKVPVEPGMPPAGDEHVLCDDNRFIADLAYDFKQAKAKDGGAASKLLFKKRMFRETDETVTEPQFVNLSYIQAQHDYLQVRALRCTAALGNGAVCAVLSGRPEGGDERGLHDLNHPPFPLPPPCRASTR